MGCGESKHDVVSGNTVSHRKKQSKSEETISETEVSESSTDSSVQQPEIEISGQDSESEKAVVTAAADVKDIAVNGELEEGEPVIEGDRSEVVVGGNEPPPPEKLVSRDSPDRYFSSRKDDDAIERIVGDEGEIAENGADEKGLVDGEDNGVHAENFAEDLKEQVTIKEAELETTIESEAVENNKILVVVEEHSSDASPSDAKTN